MMDALDVPLPDSPSPTDSSDSATLSWPSTGSGAKEDQTLLQHEVAEAVAEVALLAAAEQDQLSPQRSPLITTSRDLAPIETTAQEHQSAEEETPTQLFQTPISPSHTASADQPPSDHDDEAPSELPFLAEVEEVAPQTIRADQPVMIEDQQETIVEQDGELLAKFTLVEAKNDDLREQASAGSDPARLFVNGRDITSLAAKLSDEEIEEIQRSPMRQNPHVYHSLFTLNTSDFSRVGPEKPMVWSSPDTPNPQQSPRVRRWDINLKAIAGKEVKETSSQLRPDRAAARSSVKQLLVPSVGIASSEDSSSEDDDERLLHPQHTKAASTYTRLSRQVPDSQAPPPAPARRSHSRSRSRPRQSYSDQPPRPRTSVSTSKPRQRPSWMAQPPIVSGIEAAPQIAPKKESQLSVMELIGMLKKKLQEDETFRYVLKGVMAEHEEGRAIRASKGGEGNLVEPPAPKSQAQRKSTEASRGAAQQMHTDSGSELEINFRSSRVSEPIVERKASTIRPRDPTPIRHALSSFPMTRSPFVVPASLAAHPHLTSFAPRRANPPTFSAPRDLTSARKPIERTAVSKKQSSRRPKDSKTAEQPQLPRSQTGPMRHSSSKPPPSSARAAADGTDAEAFEPRSATLAYEEAARQAKEHERQMAEQMRNGSRREKVIPGGDSGRGQHTKESFYRADAPRPPLQRRHSSKVQDRKAERQRSSAKVSGEVDLSTKISLLGRPGGPQYPDPAMNQPAPPVDKRPLQLSTKQLPPTRPVSKSAAVASMPSVWGTSERLRRRASLHVTSFDFDDFA